MTENGDVLVKGMKMPESCFDCPLIHGEYLICTITGSDLRDVQNIQKERAQDCPLISCATEPQTHGDAIRRSTDAQLAAMIAHSIACSACPEFPCRKTEQECVETWESWMLKKKEAKRWFPC